MPLAWMYYHDGRSYWERTMAENIFKAVGGQVAGEVCSDLISCIADTIADAVKETLISRHMGEVAEKTENPGFTVKVTERGALSRLVTDDAIDFDSSSPNPPIQG